MYLRRTRDKLSVDVQNLITLCLSTQARIGYPAFDSHEENQGLTSVDFGIVRKRRYAFTESHVGRLQTRKILSQTTLQGYVRQEKKRQEQREKMRIMIIM